MFNVGRYMGDDVASNPSKPIIKSKKRDHGMHSTIGKESSAVDGEKQKKFKSVTTQQKGDTLPVPNSTRQSTKVLNSGKKKKSVSTSNVNDETIHYSVGDSSHQKIYKEDRADDEYDNDERGASQGDENVFREAVIEKTPSVVEDSDSWGLDARLTKSLVNAGIERFFPIQRQVVLTMIEYVHVLFQ